MLTKEDTRHKDDDEDDGGDNECHDENDSDPLWIIKQHWQLKWSKYYPSLTENIAFQDGVFKYQSAELAQGYKKACSKGKIYIGQRNCILFKKYYKRGSATSFSGRMQTWSWY